MSCFDNTEKVLFYFLLNKLKSYTMSFGTGSGLVFVRSAYGQALAYFSALGLKVGEQSAVVQKFGFPSHPILDGANQKYSFADTPYVLALVQQLNAPPSVLAFGPKAGHAWPSLALQPDGSHVVAAAIDPNAFGVLELASPGRVLGTYYLAKDDGSAFHEFDPVMAAAQYVIVGIDRNVATTFLDGVIVDVTSSLSEVVTSDPNDAGAVIAVRIQSAIDALENSCADFHKMGRVADYKEMLEQLQAASQTINLHLTSDIDLVSYNQDLQAITVILSQITHTITQTVTIDDSRALETILTFIQSLDSCKQAVQSFHVAISSVSVINVPKSLKDTTTSIRNFNDEVKCIAEHLKFFATGQRDLDSKEPQEEFDLSAARRAEIAAAVASVKALASIGDADITNIQAQAVKDFQDQTKALAANVSSFDSVLASLASSLSAYLPPATQIAVSAAVRASQAAAQARASRVQAA